MNKVGVSAPGRLLPCPVVSAPLQGATVDVGLANPIEPTNALAVTLGP